MPSDHGNDLQLRAGALAATPEASKELDKPRTFEDKLEAAAVLSLPELNSGRAIAACDPHDPDALEIATMMLRAIGNQAVAGDREAEIRMLAAQAKVLDFVIATAVGNAARTSGSTAALLLRVATQAQEQCRRTLETLDQWRTPRPAIGTQVNVQVNAGSATPATLATPPALPDPLDRIAGIVGNGDWTARVVDADGVSRTRTRE